MDGIDAFGLSGVGDRDEGVVAPEAMRGIQAFPARARKIHFGPGMHGPGGTVIVVGGSVEISAHKAGGEAEGAAELDEQDRKIAAGAGSASQRHQGRLDAAGLAALVGQLGEDEGVELAQVADGVIGSVDKICLEPGAELALGLVERWGEVGRECEIKNWLVRKRETDGVELENEVEGIVVQRLDLELGAQIQGIRPVPEMGPGEGVVVGIADRKDLRVGLQVETEPLQAVQGGLARTDVENVGGRTRLRVRTGSG